MTNKEWLELWDWAENLDNAVFLKIVDIENRDYKKDRFGLGYLIICKDGSIKCSCCDEILFENRTPSQIKSIIENLL